MTPVEQLLEWQRLDEKIRAHDRAMRELPARAQAEALDQVIGDLTGQKAATERELQAERRLGKQAEQDLEVHAAELRLIEEKLYGGTIQSPKELSTLQARADESRAHQSKLEDAAIDSIGRSEALQATIVQLAEQIEDCRRRRAAIQKEIDQALSTLHAARELLEFQRDDLKAELPQDLALAYQRLYEAKAYLPVAEVRGEICMTCRVALPTGVLASARSNKRLVHCDQCGRILCWVG